MRFLGFLAVVCFVTACSNSVESTFQAVDIERVYTDSLSIRAIAPLDANRVWFAADKGMVGLIDNGTPKLANIRYEEKLLQFRAIAATQKAVFVLSVANPGVLYKIGYENNEATSIEEVYTETGDAVFYDAMTFWDENEGIAMGDPVAGCMSILITRNGGASWQKLPCEQLPPVREGEAAFAASNSNIAVVGQHAWIATGGASARVFHTPNRGQTWEVFDTPMVQGKEMTGIYSIDFYDEKRGVIVGGNWNDKDFNEGNKAITNDGGITWTLVANGEGPGYRSSVAFVPNGGGEALVAVGTPGISYSSDAGATWRELSEEGFFAIEFVNDSLAFASGKHKISKLHFRK